MEINKINLNGTDYDLRDTSKTANIGTVTAVKLGASGSSYSPTNGIVTLPAYPEGGAIDYTVTTTDIQQIDSTVISLALRKVQLALTSSEKAQVLTNLGIPNARNITVSTSDPTSNDGNDGDIWVVYE